MNNCSTKLGAIELFITTLINVLYIIWKGYFNINLGAACFCTLNNQLISRLQCKFYHLFGFLILKIALRALISSFIVPPLCITVFAAYSHLTISTKKRIMCKLFANTTDILANIFLVRFVWHILHLPFFLSLRHSF